MSTKTTKSTSRTSDKTTSRITSNGTMKSPEKNERIAENAQAEHAAKGGKALLKVWKRIAERNGESS